MVLVESFRLWYQKDTKIYVLVNAAIPIQEPTYTLTVHRVLHMSLKDFLDRSDAKTVADELLWKELQDLAVHKQPWLERVWFLVRSCWGR